MLTSHPNQCSNTTETAGNKWAQMTSDVVWAPGKYLSIHFFFPFQLTSIFVLF
jgi:hypothetical protein